MNADFSFQLATIDAVRPVFMIVMGAFLLLIAWRLAQNSQGWTARMMISGAMLLALGYMVVLPLYEAGKILSPKHPMADASALAWHAVKLTAMNAGWLLFGIGIAMHAKLFRVPTPAPKPSPSPTVRAHGTAA